MKRTRRSQGGFTLIELMVSLVLFSFAIAGVLAIAVSMSQGYREQRQVVQTESTARNALDYIADALRMTSPAFPNAAITYVAAPPPGSPHLVVGTIEDTEQTAGNCDRGAVRVYNNTGVNGTDELEVVFASGATVTTLSNAWVAGNVAAKFVDTSNFAVGDRVLITNGTTGHIMKIAAIGGGGNVVFDAPAGCTFSTPTYQPAGDVTAPSLVVRVLHARFYVGTFDGITNLVLLMDPDSDGAAPPEPLADYVEDFQVAAGIDESGPLATPDGWIDPATEWAFAAGAGAFTNTRLLRGMRITLVARAPSSLVATTASYRRPTVEDHPQAATLDTFRRRVLSSTIDLRNVGGSP